MRTLNYLPIIQTQFFHKNTNKLKCVFVALVCCFLGNINVLHAQGPCTIDLDPNTPGQQNDAAAAGLTIADIDMSANYYSASPYTPPASTGGAASLTVNDGTEFCDENGAGTVTGSEEGPDLIIMIPVPPENALSCADGVLEICLRGDFNNACEVAFIANAAGDIIAQSETTGVPACAGPAPCVEVTIPGCDLKADAADGMLMFEIRTNGEAVSTGATGDQVDDTCTGGAGVDETGDGNLDGNCITFESFVWPTDNVDDFTLTCPDAIGPIEGCTTADITEGNAGFGYSAEEADITELDNALTITGCTPASITYIDSAPEIGACPYNFTITRTFTVTDPCDEVLSCTQLITVEDTTPPVVVCPDNVVGLDCNTAALPEVMATATDNCSPPDAITIEFVDDIAIDAIDPCVGGVITRTFTPTDECGNVGVPCMMTFTFDPDITPPEITCPDPITVTCADVFPAGVTDINAFLDLPGASAMDNCSAPDELTVAFVDDIPYDTCVDGPITRTYTVTDACGNEATCTQIITVVADVTPPVFVEDEPADMTITCIDPIPAPPTITATDDCTEPVVVELVTVDDMLVCPETRTITYTWTATDDCMNTVTFDQVITILPDTTPPTLSDMPADVNLICTDPIPAIVPVTGADDCGFDSIMFDEVDDMGVCPEPRVITRTWTAIDDCMNETVYTQTITIAPDTTPPTLSEMPADENLTCADPIPDPPAVTAMDDCTMPQEVIFVETDEGVCPADRVITRTWTATDECMNEVTYTQTITIAPDTTPPTLRDMPADLALICTDAIPPADMITAMDDCTDPIIPVLVETDDMGVCPEPRVITRTWTATDECMNETTYTQTITIAPDTTPPTLSDMPADVDLVCGDPIPPVPEITATDDCTEPQAVVFEETNVGVCPEPTVIMRTWTATDDCGNETTYTQVINIPPDDTPPVLSEMPADIDLICTDAIPPPAAVTATDDCIDPIEVVLVETDDMGVCPDPRIITRTWTSTDACLNEVTYTQTITVAPDTTPPTLSEMPADVDLVCGEPIPDPPAVTATDDCTDPQEVIFEETNVGVCPDPTVIMRTWTATDDCGNVTTHTQIINIPPDDTAPVLSDMPADIDLICTDAIPPPAAVTATDDCIDPIEVVLVETDDMGVCPAPRIITRTWTATDACLNEVTYTQTITIAPDTTPPTLSDMPADENLTCADAIPAAPTITATDDCTDPQVVVLDEVDDMGVCPDPRIITRTWTATDDCMNETTYTQTITIAPDTTPPTVTCPPDDPTVYSLETDVPAPAADLAAFEALGGTAMDDCGTMMLTVEPIVTPCPGMANQGMVVYTYTITDECGNEATCDQTFLFSCCDAAAGMLAPIENVCLGDEITTTVDGTEAPAPDYGYDYVLTDAAGAIIAGPQGNGTFTPTAPGDYCVHGVNYQIATGPPDYSSGDINTVTHPTDCIETTNVCFTIGDIPMATIEACPNGPAPTDVLVGLEGTYPMDMIGILPDIYIFCEPGCLNGVGTGGTAPYTYEWFELSDECSYDFGAPIASTQDASGLGTGTYTVVVTDANGCTASYEAKVFVDTPPELTASDDACICPGECFDLEGTSTVGPGICLEYCAGELPVCPVDDNTIFTVCFDFTYPWISDLNLILEAPDGTQVVLVSSAAFPNADDDGMMCFTNDASVGGGILPGGGLDALDWNNYPSGTADAAGLGIGVSGNWFPMGGQGAFSAFNGIDLNSGSWQVIILDDLVGEEGFFNSFTLDILAGPGCELSVAVDINQDIIDFIPTTIETEPVECEEYENCTATYQWTGDDGFDSGEIPLGDVDIVTETFPPLNVCPTITTTYTLTVIDCFGCESTEEVIIEVTEELMAVAVSDTCGVIDITSITGGVPDYTITIGNLPGATDALFTAGPSPDASVTPEFMDLPAGDYFIVVTDSKGCTFELGPITVEPCTTCEDFMVDIYGCGMPIDSFIVDGNYPDGTIAPLPEVFVYCEGDVGCLDAVPMNGTAPYTYEWLELTDNCDYTGQPVGTDSNLSDLQTGTYQVTVTDAAGCVVVFEAKIFIDTDPTINLNNGGDTEIWVCKEGEFNIPAAALPGPDFCKEYCGGELPLCPIDAASIITVCLEFDHTFISDLSFELVAPDGTIIPLVTAVCCPINTDTPNNVFDFCFTNDPNAPVLDWNNGTAPTSGSVWQPTGGGSVFAPIVGVDANAGPWAMIVTDIVGGDSGTFNSFEVTITGGTCETVFSSPDFDAPIPDNQESFTYETPVLECFNIENIISEYSWTCSDGTGTGVIPSTNNEIDGFPFVGTDPGTYTCTLEVFDLWGCSTTADFIINVPECVESTSEITCNSVTINATGGYAGANGADYTFTIDPDPNTAGAVNDPAMITFDDLPCGDYTITINDNTPVPPGGQTWADAPADGSVNGQTCFDIPVAGYSTVLGLPNGAILDFACIDINSLAGVDLVNVTLTSPAGTMVTLMDVFGGQFGTDAEPCFQDGQPGIGIGTPPFGGSFSPFSGALGGFDGEDPNGTWTLCVTDVFGVGDITLEGWSLVLTSEPCLATIDVNIPCDPIAAEAESMVCGELDITSITGGNADYIITIGTMPDASDAIATVTVTDASAMPEFTGLAGGDYYIEIVDADGCLVVIGPITVAPCDDGCDLMAEVEACPNGPTPTEILEDLLGVYPMDVLDTLPDVYIFCEPGCLSGVPVGGTAPYTYEWFELSDECTYDLSMPIATTQEATGLGTGNYTVVITDADGCTAEHEVKVFIDVPPILTTTPDTLICANECIDLEGTSTVGPGICLEYCEGELPVCPVDDNTIFTVCFDFTYPWISDLNLILEAPDGTQVVLVSSAAFPNADQDGMMCFTNDASVGGGILPGGGLDALDWNNYPSGTADAAVIGIGVSGNWFPMGGQGAFSAFNGIDINSGTWQVIILDDLAGQEGFFNSFTLDILAGTGCELSVAVDINQDIIDFVPTTIETEPIECDQYENCTATYQWTGDDGYDSGVLPIGNLGIDMEVLPPTNVCPATGATTTYTLTVFDCLGCSSTETVVITVGDEIMAAVESLACGELDITSITGGTADYTITIGLQPDASDALATGTFTDASAAPEFTGLTGGDYYIQITDANGCLAAILGPVTVLDCDDTACDLANVTIDFTPSTLCAPDGDGTITVTTNIQPTPVTITLSNGDVITDSGTFTDLPAGTYTIQITTTDGCDLTTDPITIEQPMECNDIMNCPDFAVEIFGCAMPIDSFIVEGNYPDGTLADLPEVFVYCEGDLGCLDADVMGMGGTPPYTFEWFELTENCNYNVPPFATGESIDMLETGTYQVVVTDSLGCQAAFEAKIFIDTDPTINLNNGGDTEIWLCNEGEFNINADALPGPDFCKEYCGGTLPLCPIDDASIITVCMEFDHTFISDLSFDLVAPDGTIIPLVTAECCPINTDTPNNVFDFCFTNDPNAPVLDWNNGTAPTSGSVWQPTGGASVFGPIVGVDANAGPWAMIVTDIVGGDSGQFNSFEVTITGGTCQTVFSSPDFNAPIPDNNESFTYETPILECFEIENIISEYEWTCSDGSGTGIVPSTNNEIDGFPFMATAGPGQYTCTLEVWDLWGCSTTTDFIVNVPDLIDLTADLTCNSATINASGGYAGVNGVDFTFTIDPDTNMVGAVNDPAMFTFDNLPCGDYTVTVNDNTPVPPGGQTWADVPADGTVTGQTCFDIPVSGYTTVLGLPNGAILDFACFDVAGGDVSGLNVTLTSPAGTSVILMDLFGGQLGPDAEPCFQDGQPGIGIGTPPFGGTFSPNSGTLAGFNGEDPNGTWTLCVTDGLGLGATLEDWSLVFTSEPCLATIDVNIPCDEIVADAISPACGELDIISLYGGIPDYTVTIGFNMDASDAIATATVADSLVTPDFSGLAPGDYYIAVTDAPECSSIILGPITVVACDSTACDLANVIIDFTDSTLCDPDGDGTITVSTTIPGPVTFTLSNGDVITDAGTFANLPAGTYTIEITAGPDCTLTSDPIVIGEPVACDPTACDLANVTIEFTESTLCAPDGDGTITVSTTITPSPVTFTLSDGQVVTDAGAFADLPAGTYTIEIMAGDSCTLTSEPVIIGEPVDCPGGGGDVFDLALIKELTSAGPFSPGDDVTFTITVTNQGTVDATSFELTDYIPAGMTLSTNDTNGWAGPATGPVTVMGAALAAGATITIDITLTIDASFTGTELVNYAEISDDDNAQMLPDTDSTPDGDNTNDADGDPNSPADNTTGGDGTGTPGGGDPATDEDDHDPALIDVEQDGGAECSLDNVSIDFTDSILCDPEGDGTITVSTTIPSPVIFTLSDGQVITDAGTFTDLPAGMYTIEIMAGDSCNLVSDSITIGEPADCPGGGGDVFDLALIKELTSAGPFSLGDDVTFTITVTNQGTVDATSFELTDYIPAGMTLSTNDANGWAGSATGPVTVLGAALAAGATITIDITLTIDASFTGTELVNYAEISDDDNAQMLPDTDSTPDGDNTNDADGDPNSPADNTTGGDGTGTPGGGDPATDEDDHDPALIDVEQDMVGCEILPEAVVNIVCDNQGTADAGDDTYTFDISVMGSNSSASNTFNDDAGNSGIAYGSTLSYGPYPISGGDITITFTDADDAMCTATITATAPATCSDDVGGGDCEILPEAAVNIVCDNQGTADAGDDTYTFDITVMGSNSGASNTFNDDAGNSGIAYGSTLSYGPYPISGGDITITFTDADDAMCTATITATAPATCSDDVGGGDVFDLALIKELSSAGPFAPGDDVTFTITVTNQGNVDATSYEVTDYIPTGLTLSSNDANGWAGPATGPVTLTNGALAAGASTTIDIILTIDATFTGALVNYAEISDDENAQGLSDVDSTPDNDNNNDADGAPDSPADNTTGGDGTGTPGGSDSATDEDDHDPASIEVEEDPTTACDLANVTIDFTDSSSCAPDADGTITVSTTIPSPVTFTSSAGGTVTDNGTFLFLPGGTYTIDINAGPGCALTSDPITIGEPVDCVDPDVCTLDNVTISAIGSALCLPDGDGSITVSSSLPSPVTFTLSDGQTIIDGGIFSGLPGGIYTIEITTGVNCTLTSDQIILSQLDDCVDPDVCTLDNVTITSTESTICDSTGDGTITVSTTIPSPVTFTLNGVDVIDAGTFTDLSAGTYTVEINAGSNCTLTSDPITIGEPADCIDPADCTLDNVIIDFANSTLCGADGDGNITVDSSFPSSVTFTLNGVDITDAGTFGNLPAGTYTVEINAGQNCTLTSDPITIGEPGDCPGGPQDCILDNVTIDFADSGLCAPDSDGSITVSTTLSGPVVFTLSDGQSLSNGGTFSGLPAGDYTIDISAPGCDLSAGTITIGEPAGCPPVAECALENVTITSTDATECAPLSNGSIEVSTTIPGPITFTLNDGQFLTDGGTFIDLGTGTYTIAISGTDGCELQSDPISIAEPSDCPDCSLDFVTITPTNSTECNENANGYITVSTTIPGPVTFTLNTGEVIVDNGVFTGLSIGMYFVEISGPDGCELTSDNYIIGQPAVCPPNPNDCVPANLQVIAGDVTLCDGTNNGSATVFTSISGSFTFTLSNGESIVDNGVFDDLAPGIYTVQASAPGCMLNSLPFAISEPADCPDIFDLALKKQIVSAGPYAPGDDVTFTINVVNQGNVDATSLEITDYIPAGMSLSTNDVNGWTGPATGPVTYTGGLLTVGASITVEIILTIDASFIGTSLINYAEISNADNAGGLPDVDSAPDNDDSNDGGGLPDSSSDNQLDGDGTGGTGSANPVTDEDDHDPASIEVDDSGVCDVANITINATDATLCAPDSDGTISVSTTLPGPVTFTIDDQSIIDNGIFTGYGSGTYLVVVNGLSGCVLEPAPISIFGPADCPNEDCNLDNISVTVTNSTACAPNSDGIITIISSIEGNAEFSIDGGATFQSDGIFTSLAAGSYSIVISTDTNCSIDAGEFTIEEPAGCNDCNADAVEVIASNTTCGASDGSITINAAINGTVEYSIDGGATFQSSNTFNGLSAGSYNVVVRDIDGVCVIEAETATITEPAGCGLCSNDFVTINVGDATSCGGSNGSINIIATIIGTEEYSIDGGATFQTNGNFTDLPAGTYAVVVQNTEGNCSLEAQDVTIGEPEICGNCNADALSITTTDVTTCGGDDGTITISSTIDATFTYSIDGGANFSASGSFTGLAAGDYTVTVQTLNGNCVIDGGTASINEPAACGDCTADNITVEVSNTSNCEGTDGTITITVNIGGEVTYSIDGGTSYQSENVFENLSPGAYSISVQTTDGVCTVDGIDATVSTPAGCADCTADGLNITATDVTACGTDDGTITIAASFGGTYEFSIDGGNTYQSSGTFDNLAGGTYSIVVTNTEGVCAVDGGEVTIDTPSPVIGNINVIDIKDCDNPDGLIAASASGDAAVQYSINGGATWQSSGVFTILTAGDYQISVQYTDGTCTVEGPVVTVNPPADYVGGEVAITCPSETVMNICAPIAPPVPLNINDFGVGGCDNASNFTFEVEEITEINDLSISYIQNYTITDANNNVTTCQVIYNSITEFLEAPEIQQPAPACAGDLLGGIKIPDGAFNFYSDEDGSPGELLSSCDYGGVICSTDGFSVDINTPGVYTIWVTQIAANNYGAPCESEAVPILFQILPLPQAELTTAITEACFGETLMLIDYVADRSNGSWTGPGVISTSDMDGNTMYMFNGDGLAMSSPVKIFYTVDNGMCAQSYTLMVEIGQAPSEYWDSPGNLCFGSAQLDLNDFLSGGIDGEWTGSGVSSQGMFNAVSGPGTYTISFVANDTEACNNVQTREIVVNGVPDASFEMVPSVCADDDAVDLMSLLLGDTGGSFSGDGVVDNMFSPDLVEGGEAAITYSVTSEAGCTSEFTIMVTVTKVEPPVGTYPDQVVCSNASVIALGVENIFPFTYNWYSGDGSTLMGDGSEILIPVPTDEGSYTFLVEAVSPDGCSSEQLTEIFIEVIDCDTCAPIFSSDVNTNFACSGDVAEFMLTLTDSEANDQFVYLKEPNGNLISLNSVGDGQYFGTLELINTDCAPLMNTYTIIAYCNDNETSVGAFTEDIVVYPSTIEQFIKLNESDDGCSVIAEVVEGCEDYILPVGTWSADYDSAHPKAAFEYEYFSTAVNSIGCFSGTGTVYYTLDCDDASTCSNANDVSVSTATGNVCSGEPVQFILSLEDSSANDQVVTINSSNGYEGSLSSIGNGQYAATITLTNNDCAPAEETFTITAYCNDGVTEAGSFTETITVYTNNIEQYITITASADGCTATASVIAGCEDYILQVGDWVAVYDAENPDGKGFDYAYFEEVSCFDNSGNIPYTHDCEIEPPVECENEAGLMQTSQTYVCEGDQISYGVAFNTADGNSVTGYVLHEGEFFNPATTTVIASSTNGLFGSPGSSYNNIPLYVTAVTGYPNADGLPQLDHECTVWAPYGAYTIFLDPIAVSIVSEECDNNLFYITITVNGGIGVISPQAAYLTVTDGNTTFASISANEEVTFGPYSNGTNYQINIMDVKGCLGAYAGTATCGGAGKTSNFYSDYNNSIENVNPSLVIYPNPTAGIFSLSGFDINNKVNLISIHNVLGEVIQQHFNDSSNRVDFDIKSQPPGIYLVKVTYTNNDYQYLKLIKK